MARAAGPRTQGFGSPKATKRGSNVRIFQKYLQFFEIDGRMETKTPNRRSPHTGGRVLQGLPEMIGAFRDRPPRNGGDGPGAHLYRLIHEHGEKCRRIGMNDGVSSPRIRTAGARHQVRTELSQIFRSPLLQSTFHVIIVELVVQGVQHRLSVKGDPHPDIY